MLTRSCRYGLLLVIFSTLGARAETHSPRERASVWLGAILLPTANYVKNGGFEQGLDGWSYFEHRAGGLDFNTFHAEAAALRMGGRDENKYVYLHQYNVPLQTGRTYTLSAWVKAKGVSTWGADHMSTGAIFLTNYGWTESISLKPAGATFDWTRLTRTFVAMPTKPRADGRPSYTLTVFWPPKSDGEFWLDEIQIEDGDHPQRQVGESGHAAFQHEMFLLQTGRNRLLELPATGEVQGLPNNQIQPHRIHHPPSGRPD